MKRDRSAPPADPPSPALGAPKPTPAPPGRLLLTRGLVALAACVLGCTQKASDPADSVQPELNANAPTPEPTPQKQPEPPPPSKAADPPPASPFLVAPGGVAAAPAPTPTPTEPPRLVPTSTKVNPLIVNTIVAPHPPPPHPPAPPPHPWNNAPHPWRGNDTAPHTVPVDRGF